MKTESQGPRWIRFGCFEVDLHAGELRKQGIRIKLQDKPFQILSILLMRAGEVVTREELCRQLWRDDTFVDFDRNLNSAVNRLRQVLNDSADQPRYLETIPRHGYRFLVPVTYGALAPEPREQAGSRKTQTEPNPQVERSGRHAEISDNRFGRRATAALLAVVVIVVVSAGAYWGWEWRRNAADTRIVVAVLPFRNLTGDPKMDHVSDGLTADLILQMGSMEPKRVAVIAQTSTMSYRSSGKRIDEIARELGADYVLEGFMVSGNGRARVNAILVAADEQIHEWSSSYEAGIGNPMEFQRQIASQICEDLLRQILPQPPPASSRSPRQQ